MAINSRANVIGLFADAAVKGPVIISQGFDSELQATVEVMEFDVANKSRIPADLPFGLLVAIMPGNINKTRMKVRVGPGYYSDTGLAWPEICAKVKNFNEWICVASVCTQVVPVDFDVATLEPTDLWEATVTPIDERHGLLKKVYVVEAAVMTEDVWDEALQTYTTVTRTITQTKGDPETVAGEGGFTHLMYVPIRCDWWLSVLESYGTLTLSYSDMITFYWPAVMSSFELMDWARRDGGVDIFPKVEYAKGAYDGPCKVTVTKEWSLTPFTITAGTQMLPTSVVYGCPFFNLSIPPCLHGEIYCQADTGTTDAIYSPNSGSLRIFPATNVTDWPSSVKASDLQEPFKGGYMRTTKTVYPPS